MGAYGGLMRFVQWNLMGFNGVTVGLMGVNGDFILTGSW